MSQQHSPNPLKDSEIAIIGMSCHFPGAKNIDEFWYNLRYGVESILFFNQQELLSSGVDADLLNRPDYVKANSVISDIELFDARFFDFSAREAEITDPQQRFFLEHAWKAMENAGYNTENYKGSVGVYASIGINTYLLNNLYKNLEPSEIANFFQLMIGNNKDFLSTRVSYQLNLNGPSVNVQTACSSSLVAVHLACQSLLNGECDMALAGGVSIRVPQNAGYLYQEGMILSPDGHCRAFDAKAKGTVAGDGLGIVVLKRLEDALADGDCIYAVIKGSAINNDGSLKVGYTAPSVAGQTAVISEAQAIAGIEPETLTYIEAHGTGTVLGDPIEIAALRQAFDTTSEKKGFCAIGSVKTNFGHLDTAAGVAGLIKTVLALKHKMIPPSLHFEQPNPEIDFDNSPFYVNTKLSKWRTNGTPRRAGVSSFGFGGTNAHVVLEEAPEQQSSQASRPWQLLLVSAKTSTALETATANLAAHLQQQPQLNLADVAYTLQVGRHAFDYRRMVVCRDLDDGVTALESLEPQRVFTHHHQPGYRDVVFMFSGQGSQYVNMAQELYQSEPTFRQQVDICTDILQPLLGLDIRNVLYPSQQTNQAVEQLNQTAITQPALFVIEYALAQLWMEWGVLPTAMIGHSIGEYVAATIAGVFSLEDALALVTIRGKLMQQLPQGSMLAIPLPEQEVKQLLTHAVCLAAINSPSMCVVSGLTDAIDTLDNYLASQGVECRRLHTSHAFHSQMMDPILEEFWQAVTKVNLQPPQIPLISNVTGTWMTAEEAINPSYWATHLRQTVRFAEGLQHFLKEPAQILLEVGPGKTLSTLAQRHPALQAEQVVLSSLRHPQQSQSDVAFLLTTLGKLWLSGIQVDWSSFYTYEQRHRLPLPTYPFERQRYWIDAKPASLSQSSNPVILIDKKLDIVDWFYIPSWKRSLLPNLSSYSQAEFRNKQWLVFVDEHGVSLQLVNKLKQKGKDVITVKVGKRFTKLSEGIYTINPQNRDDYDALLKDLIALSKTPQNIAHFWTLNTWDNYQTSEYLEFNSLLFLAQTLGKHKITNRLQIWVVSNQIQEVNGDEKLNPEKATVLSLCKVIPQEYPNITCRSIDVVLPQSDTWQEEKLIDQLLSEFMASSSDLVVAYRNRYRLVQTFEPMRLEPAVEEKIPLKKQGIYLFTDGLEGIGVALAEYLAQTVQAKLIFVENSILPEKEQYLQWLETHEQQDEISRKIRKLQALEELGAEVLVVFADVNNYKQMYQNLTPEKIGQIHGVIHSSEKINENLFCSIQETDKIDLEKLLHFKCYSICVLEEVLQGRQLDFCIILSSLSSVLGGFGLAAYSAANLFLDVFTRRHNQTDTLPWLTINWDRWQRDETKKQQTFGQAYETELAITQTEGVEVFKRILSLGEETQVLVSTVDLKARSDRSFKLESLPDTNPSPSHQWNSSSRYSRPNLSNPYVPPTNQLEKLIAEMWQEILGIEQVGIYDNFFELGGDSLIATQLVSRWRATFPVDLPLRDFLLQASTVAKQAEMIEELLLEKIQELSEEEVKVLLANR
ncbi:acyltransferase domain-containing protein [Mastigocladus laminosus UU774]|nr:acyltransferase domain-containing protein [Mastigocladus laminosus UU774]